MTEPRRAPLLALVLLGWLAAVLAASLSMAGAAAAHAELVASDPANGEQLDDPPTQVTLRFTESVALVDGGFELLDAQGEVVTTGEPVAEGSQVRWPMPAGLPDGPYLVSWRVISGDSHPVSGAFSFGVGVVPVAVEEPARASDAPWPVTASRLGGYVGFTVVTGAVTLTMACWAAGRRHPRTQLLLRSGLAVAAVSAVLGLLVQGPYAVGVPMTRLLDRSLLAETSHTAFGAWTQLRLYLYLALAGVLWAGGTLDSRLNRWLAGIGLALVSLTHAGTGHAAASGRVLDLAADAVHMLAAGVWAGGLLTLAVAATARSHRPTLDAFMAFSRVALLCVLALVATGTINGVLQLDAFAQLWQTRYGQLLTAKLALVSLALAAARFSRRRLHREEEPWSTVRMEAATTLAVLAVTAVLASTSPPDIRARPTPPSPAHRASSTSIEMDLGEGRTALLHVDGLDTSGSSLHLELLDRTARPLAARAVRLRASLPSRDLGPLEVPLRKDPAGWRGAFSFPLPGTWTLTLTVEERNLAAVVTTGQLEISLSRQSP